MTTEHNEIEMTNGRLRRDLLLGVALLLIPLMLMMSVREMYAGHPSLASLYGMGSMLLTVVWYAARYIGLSQPIIRGTFAYFVFLVLFYAGFHSSPTSLMLCLLIPIVSTICFGYREAALWSIVAGIACVFMLFKFGLVSLSHVSDGALHFGITYLVISFITTSFDHLRGVNIAAVEQKLLHNKSRSDRIEEQSLRQFEDLLQAVKEVKELSGIIPICSCCKKVRTEEDLWEHLEPFLDKRTQLTFSHGVCPTCTEETLDSMHEPLAHVPRQAGVSG